MNHLLKLFNDTVIEIQGFDDSQFYIFKDEDRKDLTHMWYHEAGRNPNKFISMLSPEQKDYVSLWTLRKVNTPLNDIIQNLSYSLKEFQGLAERYQGTLDKPQRIKPKAQTKRAPPNDPPPPYFEPSAPPMAPVSITPVTPNPPPNFKDLSKVCPASTPLYPTLSQVLENHQQKAPPPEYMNVKAKSYKKDMKKIEALKDKYNLSVTKVKSPVRQRDVSRARLKSGFQAIRDYVLIPSIY